MNKVAWLLPLPEFIKQRLCRYLIQHYLGHFFEEKISLEQLKVDIYKGTAVLKDIKLDCSSLNEQLESLDLPFVVTSGQIGNIYIYIPWHNLLNESCKLEVKNLCLIIRPKKREFSHHDGSNEGSTTASMFSSMFLNSQYTSMEIAKECLLKNEKLTSKEENFSYFNTSFHDDADDDDDKSQDTFEFESTNSPNLMGLEAFASTIDSILGRIQVSIEHTTFRLEHIIESNENNYSNGIALEFHIKSIRYFDSDAQVQFQNTQQQHNQPQDQFNKPTFSIKNFVIEGLTAYCDEFLMREKSTHLSNMSTSFYVSLDETTNIFNDKDLNRNSDCSYVYTNSFICATFSGQQKLEINIQKSFLNEATSKQHNLSIPKIELSGQFGSVKILLCPRQLHLLLKMITAFTDSQDNSSLSDEFKSSRSLKQKPIRGIDQQKFNNLLQNGMSSMTESQTTFTISPNDEKESMFSSIHKNSSFSSSGETTPRNSLPKNVAFSIEDQMSIILNDKDDDNSFDDVESLKSKSSTSQRTPKKQQQHQQQEAKTGNLSNEVLNLLSNPNFECIKMNFKVNMLSVTLLHEDPKSDNGSMLGDIMKSVSDKYFDSVSTIHTSGFLSDLSELRKQFNNACSSHNHFLLICKPINIKIINKAEKLAFNLTDLMVTIGCLELVEHLTLDKVISEIIQFDNIGKQQSNGYVDSCVKLKYTSYVPIESNSRKRLSYPRRPLNQLNINSNFLIFDIDISIIDRLVNIIPSSDESISNNYQESTFYNDDLNDLFNLTFNCPNLSLILRFPVADLRDVTSRRSRWSQNIRQQSLTFKFNDFSFKHESSTNELVKSYLITCGQLNAFYRLNEVQNDFLFVTISQEMSNLVELEIVIRDTRPNILGEKLNYCLNLNTSGPFSSVFSKISGKQNHQIKNPADRDEMNDFMLNAQDLSELVINLNIPNLKFLISDCEFLNDIYNRLVNDILMWEPTPLPNDHLCINPIDDNSLYFSTTNNNKFEMCKSFMIKKLDDLDESEIASTAATTARRASNTNRESILNKVCFKMNVKQGQLKAFVDHSDGRSYGEFDLICGNFNLCVISGEKGDINNQVICLYSDKVDLKHMNDELVQKSQFFPIDQENFEFLFSNSKTKDLIVRNNLASCLFDKSVNLTKPMISLAIESKLHPDTKPKTKNILLALNINDACLKHIFVEEKNFWLFQMLKLFEFEDIAVTGYEAPVVITELHLSVTNSSIDYRPLNLDTKALIGFKSLRLTSNVTQSSNSTLLVFNIEDIYLFLSNQKALARELSLKLDYVCVLNSDTFEFRLLIHDKPTNTNNNTKKTHSEMDIKLKCNTIQIRTCVDSCFTLIELLSYIVADGDLQSRLTESQTKASTLESTEQHSISTPHVNTNEKDESRISSLVDDAMTQSIYYQRNEIVEDNPFGVIFNGLNDSRDELNIDSDDEEDKRLISEFDIIDMIPGLGETPKNGEYTIKYLDRDLDEIKVYDNYFTGPHAKIDVLRAPSHYPVPQYTYCIQEITIIWSLFGGSDMSSGSYLNENDLNNETASVSFSCSPNEYDSRSIKTRFSKDDTSISSLSTANRSIKTLSSEKCLPTLAGGRLSSKYNSGKNLNWIMRGPRTRKLDQCIEISCSKIKAQIDLYDETNADYNYVYRLALAIGDIKIEDNLSSSAFKMFLYRHESESRPKHTNANIIFLKMLFSRSLDEQRLLECDVKLSIQPLRFNIDQDALFFIVDYFKSLFEREINFNHLKPQAQKTPSTAQESPSTSPKTEQRIYIKNFIFAPDLLIRFDVNGKYDKRPNSQLGNLANILIMLTVHFSNTEIILKRINYKRGFLGIEKLINCLIKDWFTDIQKNQVKNIIKGWGIFNSIIQFFEGFTCLFWYPIEQYRKDGRVLYGIKKGSTAFSTCTILATIELTNRLFQFTKNVAEFFYDLVTPHQTLSLGIDGDNSTILVLKNRNIRKRRNPNDIREGLTNAYYVFREGINDTADNFANEISNGNETTGFRGAVGGVLRQIPSAAIKPIVVTTEATCNILIGLKNQLNPDEKKDDDNKWKTVN